MSNTNSKNSGNRKFGPEVQSTQLPPMDTTNPQIEDLDNNKIKRQCQELEKELSLQRALHAEWIALVTKEFSRILKRAEEAESERDDYLKWVREIEKERDIVTKSTLWRSLTPLRMALELVPPQARQLLHLGIDKLKKHTFRKNYNQKKLEDSTTIENKILNDNDYYNIWINKCDTLSEEDRIIIGQRVEALSYKPIVSIIMPTYETPEDLLKSAIESVTNQLYPHWELCIADDASTSPHVRRLLEEAANQDPRIRWIARHENGHISLASNSALELATGEFVTFLDHDDVLAEKALFEIVSELNDHPTTDIIFSDEDRFDNQSGARHSPYFKPGWDPDLILSQNFLFHLSVFRHSVIKEIGGFRRGFEGSQDHDLVLRASRATSAERIRHIPSILYHWRLRGDASFSDTQLQQCLSASRRAVQEHLQLIPGGEGAVVLPHPRVSNYHRIRWPLPTVLPKVSIIIPTRDGANLLRSCTRGVLYETDYENLELIIIDNGSSDAEALALLEELSTLPQVHILSDDRPFNYSELNNLAAEAATGEILLFLNNDIEVIEPNWLKEMVSQVIRPGIGTVGARLLYGNETIQHAGVALGIGEFAGGPGIAGHFGLNESSSGTGYFAHSVLARTVCASTAACLAIRRDLFLSFKGFDEVHVPIAFNDVDLCLRLHEAGLRNVWTPFAELLHFESATRGDDDSAAKKARATFEGLYMRKKWGHILDSDPYYNANFCREKTNYSLDISGCKSRWR